MAEPKTISAGALLIRSKLPDSVKPFYDPSKPLDKAGVASLMENIVKHGGEHAHTTIQDLSDLFFYKATEHGYTTPLSDYQNESKDRAHMLDEFQHKVREVQENKRLSEREKNERLNDLSGEWAKKIWDHNLSYMVNKGSTAGLMAMTGARGNKMQFGQGTASPIMAQDIKGNPLAIAIKSSFAEGLKPAEHIAMSYGGRASTVKTQLSTSKPGALFKEIAPNVFHEVVVETDCGTQNGIVVPVTDKVRVMNHTVAGTHTVITEPKYKEILASGIQNIKIRTPLTCEAKQGVCQHCYGFDSYGGFPRIGQNVGVIAAQSVSEVLTQAMLSTKHKGGVAGKNRDAYEEVDNIIHLKENFMNEAVVAHLNGVVQSVTTDSLNAKHVTINGVEHFVPSNQDVVVKKGESIKSGDRVSTGVIHPRKVVELKGLGAGRRYFSEALRDAYGVANDKLDPRHFDLLSRNILKYVDVAHPGDTELMPGQRIDISHLQDVLSEDERDAPVDDNLIGKKLSRAILELTPGQVLDRNHIEYLISHGVHSVKISRSGLEVVPVIKGVMTSKLSDPNWMSRLALNRQEASLIEAASRREKAKIHGTDPVTSYVLGKEFGEGGSGLY